MFDSFHMAVVYSSDAASAAALNSATFWLSSLVWAISAAFSSAGAAATFLPDLLLLGAGGLELLERAAAHLVGAQHLVHELDGLAALALGFAHHIGMFTDELDIKHGSKTSAASRHWPPTVRHACRYR